MKKKLRYSYIINIVFTAIIFAACLWDVGSLERIRVVDDGFCYWGIAASMSGYDWKDLMSASAYYSYGYSFILIPLFWLNRLGLSMAVIYRLAIGLNACFLTGCYFMALYMIKELFKDIPEGLKYIIALFTTLYIGNTAQMGLAWTETFLVFMYWCIVVLLYRVMKKPSFLNILGLVAACAELFAIHMRSIGVVIALCMILVLFFISRRKEIDKKYCFYTIAVSAVFLGLVLAFKSYVSNSIYMGGAKESINDIGANVSRLGTLMNIRGILDIAVSFIGKLYYVGTATFMFGIVGVFAALFLLFSRYFVKDKNNRTSVRWQVKEWMTFFVLLAFLAEVGIEAIFKLSPYFRTIETRLYDDTLVFGRYADFVVGPMLIIGIWAVYNLREHYYEIIIAILASIISTGIVQFLYNVMAFRKGTDTLGLRFASTPWLSILVDGHKIDFAYYAMMLSIGVLIVMCLIKLCLPYKWHVFGAVLLAAAGVCTVLAVGKGMDYTESKLEKEKSVDTVVSIAEAAGEELPIYMFGGSNTEVKIMQWIMSKRSIRLCSVEDIDNIDTKNAIILANSADIETVSRLSDILDFLYDSGNICVFGAPDSAYYGKLSAKAKEMANVADSTISSINLANVATEYSYTKMNGSLYYNYQGAGGGYMTREMGITPDDGVYEFTVDMRARDCVSGTEIGYITVGYADGTTVYTQPLNADDFIKKARQRISLSIEIKDYAEPVIGIYTYGDASIRIYDISYQKKVGCICLKSDEVEEIADYIDDMPSKNVCYIDNDDSGLTGFPWWEHGELSYMSGKMVRAGAAFDDSYYIVEKTDDSLPSSYMNSMELLLETDNYALYTPLTEAD